MKLSEPNRMTVSVIIPAYNAAKYIAATVQSVLDQETPAHEIIVVDDGSIDQTAENVLKFGDLVKLLQTQNRGVSAARNRGALESVGDALLFLDADDLLHPQHLTKLTSALLENRSLGAATCDVLMFSEVDGDRRSIGPMIYSTSSDGLKALESGMFVSPGSTLMRREAFFVSGGFDPFVSGSVEDHKLLITAASLFPWGFVPGEYFLYRVHPESQSTRYSDNFEEALHFYGGLKSFARKRSIPISYKSVRESGQQYYCSQMFISIRRAILNRSGSIRALLVAAKFLTLHPSLGVSSLRLLKRKLKKSKTGVAAKPASAYKD
jgi:glycosyltransferase involved in cell wall biosynthesis